jgi:carbamate kinase
MERNLLMKKERIVIALGGNAIQSGDATAEAQQEALKLTAKQLIEIIKLGYQVAITHGNGPQVGNILLQQINSDCNQTPAMPLDTCGAMSEGMIGYWLDNEIDVVLNKHKIDKDVVAIVTRVEVDPDDQAFENPSKPIGPFYTEEEAKRQMEETGAVFIEDAGRGWRRVVPSPTPISILEHRVIKNLVDNGNIVISAGGGGIPVYRKDGELIGVEAVIDKDYASEKLAELIDADILMILTGVDHVFVNYNQPNQQAIEEISVEEMKKYMKEGQFARGSMLPKVEAAVQFVESKPGRKAIITSLERAIDAISGICGTRIIL